MKKSKELSEVLRRRTVDLFKCFQTQILGWSVQIIYVNASGSDMPPHCRCREKDLNCWPQMRGRMFRNILGFSKVQTCLGREGAGQKKKPLLQNQHLQLQLPLYMDKPNVLPMIHCTKGMQYWRRRTSSKLINFTSNQLLDGGNFGGPIGQWSQTHKNWFWNG